MPAGGVLAAVAGRDEKVFRMKGGPGGGGGGGGGGDAGPCISQQPICQPERLLKKVSGTASPVAAPLWVVMLGLSTPDRGHGVIRKDSYTWALLIISCKKACCQDATSA